MKKISKAFFIVPAACALLLQAHAGDDTNLPADTHSYAFSAWDENDFFGFWSDKYYTNHTRFSIHAFDDSEKNPKVFWFSFGQEFYTPDNKTAQICPPRDHPYAGYLYAAFGHARSLEKETVMLAGELQLGVVGPEAMGHGVQRDYHNFINEGVPKGWDSQIGNKFVATGIVDARKRFMLTGTLAEGYAADIIPRGFISFGNVRTMGSLGVQFRWGFNLPHDFGQTQMRQSSGALFEPSISKSFYFFADFQGDAIGYDVTLQGEGKNYKNEISVYPLAAQATFGISAIYGNFMFTFHQTFRTKDFTSQKNPFAYGGVRVSYFFK